MFILLLIGVGILALAKGSKEGVSMTYQNGGYHTQIWEPLFIALAGDNPWPLIAKWADVESGGNPCAFGKPGAKGPDGQPREMGLAQLYNPDDFKALGFSTKSFRAYCVPGTQKVSRKLTPAEMRDQVAALVALVNKCRRAAEADLFKVGAAWPRLGSDYYKLTKLQHGLPGLSRSGLPAATVALGRAPHDFAEFRATLAGLSPLKLDSGTRAYMTNGDEHGTMAAVCGLSPTFLAIMNNAESTGGVVVDRGIV